MSPVSMDASLRSPREPASAVNRPGIDDALFTTERLFGAAAGEGLSGTNAIDRTSFSAFAHSPNPHSQLGFLPAFAEDGVGSTAPYASSLQPSIVVDDPWSVDDNGMAYRTWIQPHLDFDASQASSPLLSELGSTQTPTTAFNNYDGFGEGGSLSSIPIISYNYNGFGNEELLTGGPFGHSDNNNELDNFNWGPGEQSSETTRQDSESIYDASGSGASFTDASTPITNPDQPKRFRCNPCNQDFTSQKDLKRHQKAQIHLRKTGNLLEVPVPDCKYYTCRCGYHQTRKDDYKRHLRTCKLKRRKHSNYTCRCGCQLHDKGEHLQHISDCGKGRPGRPKNNTSQ